MGLLRRVAKALRSMALICLLQSLWCPSVSAGDRISPSAAQLQAAFLYNFVYFTKWPEPLLLDLDAIGICVLGDDPYGRILDITLKGQRLGRRLIRPYRVDTAQVDQCQILYINESERSRFETLRKRLERTPVLTVSDMKCFVSIGGMIQFYLKDNLIKLLINKETIRNSGLELRANLLRLAQFVKQDENLGCD